MMSETGHRRGPARGPRMDDDALRLTGACKRVARLPALPCEWPERAGLDRAGQGGWGRSREWPLRRMCPQAIAMHEYDSFVTKVTVVVS